MMIGGFKIIANPNLVEVVGEDWSDVRSPGRAARRRKKHRQNIKPLYAPKKEFYRMGDTLIMHPAMVEAVKRKLAEGK